MENIEILGDRQQTNRGS